MKALELAENRQKNFLQIFFSEKVGVIANCADPDLNAPWLTMFV